jgi:hypothetical protein
VRYGGIFSGTPWTNWKIETIQIVVMIPTARKPEIPAFRKVSGILTRAFLPLVLSSYSIIKRICTFRFQPSMARGAVASLTKTGFSD